MKIRKGGFAGMTRAVAVAAGCLAASAVFATDFTYDWKAGECPAEILDGKARFVYSTVEEGTIQHATFAPGEGNRLVFTGDRMTFTTADGKNTLNILTNTTPGAVVFRNEVVGRMFTTVCDQSLSRCRFKEASDPVGFVPTADWVRLLPNLNLDDCDLNITRQQFSAASFGNGGDTMTPYHVVRKEDYLEFQYQSQVTTASDGRKLVKVVRAGLKQDGTAVAMRVFPPAYAVYSSAPDFKPGFDVDAWLPDAEIVEMPVRENGVVNGGYGINAFQVIRINFTYRFENAVKMGNSQVKEGARFEIADADDLLYSGASVSPSPRSLFTLQARSHTSAKYFGHTLVSGATADAGTFVFEPPVSSAAAGETNIVTLTGTTPSRAPFVVRGRGGAVMALEVASGTTGMCALPTNALVTVGAGGLLRLKTEGKNLGVTFADAGDLVVERGGVLEQCALNVFGVNASVVLNGGTLRTSVGDPRDADAGTDVYRLTMRDGARVENGSVHPDKRLRIGRVQPGVIWNIAGTAPSTNAAPLEFFGPSGFDRIGTNVFNVARTGDYDADFVCDADISRYSGGAQYWTNALMKVGAGTMRLNGHYTVTGDVLLEEGTLKLGKSNGWGAGARLVFNGGGLAAAADTTNVITRPIALNAGAQIALDAGASLSFPRLADVPWAEDARLSITIPETSGGVWRGTIRFGTDSTGLSKAQQAQVRVNGARVTLGGGGYFTKLGTVVIIR